MLKLSGTYTAMSWFPMHAALVAMIGFKVDYILEKSVPTNLNSALFSLGFYWIDFMSHWDKVFLPLTANFKSFLYKSC